MFTYKVREATLGDHDSVRDISKGIYQDTDFTTHIFPEWIADEHWLLYVAETSLGQVIGFLALNITDGGESVVVRSSRVAVEFRGKGLYKQLLNTALQSANAMLHNLKFVIRARPAHIRVPVGYKVLKISSKVTLSCSPTSADTVKFPQLTNIGCPSLFEDYCLTMKELAKLYDGNLSFKEMFKGGILTIEGETFRLSNKANWEYLEKRNDIFIIYTKYLVEKNNNNTVLSILCVSSKVTNDDKILVTLNVFGKEIAMVGYHILKALKTAIVSVGCDFNLGLFIDEELEEPILAFVKEEIDFCKTIWQRRLKVQIATLEAHYMHSIEE